MLALPSVRWGNLAVLTIFSMEAGLVFLTTLYLQNVLHFGPLATGLVFGVPGLASVAAGVVAGRIIARRGAHTVLLVALLVQGGLTAPMILLGTQQEGGGCSGPSAPSRNSCSSREVLKMPCAPPSVSAVPVMRLTTSPTMYLAR